MVSTKSPLLLKRTVNVEEVVAVKGKTIKVLALIVGVCMDVYEVVVPDIYPISPNCLPECKCKLYYEIEVREWLERNG